MRTTLETLRAKRDVIYAIADKHGVKDIRVFGSVVRGEDAPESDIDLLINMCKGKDLFDMIDFKLETEDMLNIGRELDVVPENGLYHLLREPILSEAQPL